MSQELAENDLQTDPENHLHPQPHLSTPIITLSPPTVMNSLPISLYSHTLCSGTSCHPANYRHPASYRHPANYRHVTVSRLLSQGDRPARQSTPLHVLSHSPVHNCATSPTRYIIVPSYSGYILQICKSRTRRLSMLLHHPRLNHRAVHAAHYFHLLGTNSWVVGSR